MRGLAFCPNVQRFPDALEFWTHWSALRPSYLPQRADVKGSGVRGGCWQNLTVQSKAGSWLCRRDLVSVARAKFLNLSEYSSHGNATRNLAFFLRGQRRVAINSRGRIDDFPLRISR